MGKSSVTSNRGRGRVPLMIRRKKELPKRITPILKNKNIHNLSEMGRSS